MAEFVKNGQYVEIHKLKSHEIIALMKINVRCQIKFVGTEIFIALGERIAKNNINYISISTDVDKTPMIVDYNQLIEMINGFTAKGVLIASIERAEFKLKEPLLLMLETLKQSIIDSCMMIDYNFKEHFYSIIYRKLPNGCSDKLYYFEDNNSILAFSDVGPSLIIGESSSVEELICE